MANKGLEYLIRVMGADKVRAELDRVSGGMKKTGDHAGDAGKRVGAFGGMLKSAGSSVIAFGASFFGIHAAIRLFTSLHEHMVKVRDISRELSKEAVVAQSAAMAVAQ